MLKILAVVLVHRDVQSYIRPRPFHRAVQSYFFPTPSTGLLNLTSVLDLSTGLFNLTAAPRSSYLQSLHKDMYSKLVTSTCRSLSSQLTVIKVKQCIININLTHERIAARKNSH